MVIMNGYKAIGRMLALCLLCLRIFILNDSVFGENFQIFPIPVEIEKKDVLTNMYVKLDVAEYGKNFTLRKLLNRNNLKGELLALKIFVESVLANDIATFIETSHKDAKADSTQVAATIKFVESRIKEFDSLNIFRCFKAGAMRFFVLGGSYSKTGKQGLLTIIFVEKNGKIYHSLDSFSHPISGLLSVISEFEQRWPEKYRRGMVSEPNSELIYTDVCGLDNRYPVSFLFDGYRVRYPLVVKKNRLFEYYSDLEPLLSFYSKANNKIKEGTIDEYLNCYGPVSKSKQQKLFGAEMGVDKFRRYQKVVTSYKEISYVISAPPVFILIYNSSSEPYSDLLLHEWVYDYEGSGFKRVNYGVDNYLDRFLVSPITNEKLIVDKINDPLRNKPLPD